MVVCSAGNYPGISRKVITVGSLTDSGTGTDFTDDYVSTSDEADVILIEDTAQLWGDAQWSAGLLWSDGYLCSDGLLWSDGYLWSDAVQEPVSLMSLSSGGEDLNSAGADAPASFDGSSER